MKIYNKIVLDKDNNIIEEDSFEYNGPITYCGNGGGSSSDGSAGSVTQETEDFSQQPTDYGVNMGGPSYDYDDSFANETYSADSQTSDEQMTSDPGYKEYSPTTNIENIHGETDDPDSVSYDPTYNPAYQARQTREQVFGTGEGAGESRWNPETQSMERVTNKTFAEHWRNAPESIKYSPTLKFLYATGKNVGEWAKNKDWSVSSSNNFESSGGDNESQMMRDVAPHAPYIVSGTTKPTNSPAANWYQGLGNSSLSGSNVFSMAAEYEAAKAKQKSILGSPTPIGQLAVNDSPFYNWLKERGLNKGIL